MNEMVNPKLITSAQPLPQDFVSKLQIMLAQPNADEVVFSLAYNNGKGNFEDRWKLHAIHIFNWQGDFTHRWEEHTPVLEPFQNVRWTYWVAVMARLDNFPSHLSRLSVGFRIDGSVTCWQFFRKQRLNDPAWAYDWRTGITTRKDPRK